MRVVDNLPTNVDRVGESIQGDPDDIDSSHHTGTKTPRADEKNFLDHVNSILARKSARFARLHRFQIRFGISAGLPAVVCALRSADSDQEVRNSSTTSLTNFPSPSTW